MITEWIIGLGTTIATWFVSLLPTGEIPPFIDTLDTKMNELFSALNGVGVWADWMYIFGVVTVVLAAWVLVFAVMAALKLWKLVPIIGGG